MGIIKYICKQTFTAQVKAADGCVSGFAHVVCGVIVIMIVIIVSNARSI